MTAMAWVQKKLLDQTEQWNCWALAMEGFIHCDHRLSGALATICGDSNRIGITDVQCQLGIVYR